jgi:REP element-mobilizing transposase RayT
MKYHPNGSVLFVTYRVEEGKLLLANPLCEALIKSCLARALALYPVKICSFVIEATHIHLVLVVINPTDVSNFVRHFKTETAHALNRLLGREKRTVWCEGFDSPVVLTPTRTMIALAYIYSNPAKDSLEDSIDKYPGLSSWQMFTENDLRKRWKHLRRPAFKKLPPEAHNLAGYTTEAQSVLATSKESHDFILEPNAWMEAFGIVDKEKQEKINNRIIERVRTLETRHRKKRAESGRKVMGAVRLRNEPLQISGLPKRKGIRTKCLSEKKRLRIDFLLFFKKLIKKARDVRERWKVGDYSIPYPLGLYPPSQPKLAEPLSLW